MPNTEREGLEIRLTEKDIEIIQSYVKDIQLPNCYLEIGTFEGGSALIASEVAKDGVDIYTIDSDDRIKIKNKKIHFINKSSLEAVKDWNKPVGVLFIDGDHDKAGEDFLAWEKFVVKEGYVLFHDYAHHSPNVVIHCNQLFENNNKYTILRKPNPDNYGDSSIFLVRKNEDMSRR